MSDTNDVDLSAYAIVANANANAVAEVRLLNETLQATKADAANLRLENRRLSERDASLCSQIADLATENNDLRQTIDLLTPPGVPIETYEAEIAELHELRERVAFLESHPHQPIRNLQQEKEIADLKSIIESLKNEDQKLLHIRELNGLLNRSGQARREMEELGKALDKDLAKTTRRMNAVAEALANSLDTALTHASAWHLRTFGEGCRPMNIAIRAIDEMVELVVACYRFEIKSGITAPDEHDHSKLADELVEVMGRAVDRHIGEFGLSMRRIDREQPLVACGVADEMADVLIVLSGILSRAFGDGGVKELAKAVALKNAINSTEGKRN